MILSSAFERFVEYSPISVMTRALMESAIPPEDLDRLFDAHAERQYTRSLTFSTIVELMGVVVSKSQPSLHTAIQAVSSTRPASVTSIYDKINGVEPLVVRALVKQTSEKLSEVLAMMGGQLPALLPGHRVLVLDGNHLAATERRLEVLKRSKAGPLPGHALVVLEPELMLIRDMIHCEDGHAQERSLTPEILEMVHDAHCSTACRCQDSKEVSLKRPVDGSRSPQPRRVVDRKHDAERPGRALARSPSQHVQPESLNHHSARSTLSFALG